MIITPVWKMALLSSALFKADNYHRFGLENDGLQALTELLKGRQSSLQDLRISIRDYLVSPNHMESFLEELRSGSGGSAGLQVLHLEFCDDFYSPESYEAARTFWESFKVSNVPFPFGTHLRELVVVFSGYYYMPDFSPSFEVSTMIGNKVAQVFGAAIATGRQKTLRVLRLIGVPMGSEGIKALTEALSADHLGCLELLDLSYSHVGCDGMDFLAKSLKSGLGSTLKTLGLAHSFIGKGGIKSSLGGGLEGGMCPNLLHLYLHDNLFGLLPLAEAFKSGHLKSLETITLRKDRTYREWRRHEVIIILNVLAGGSLPELKKMQLFYDYQDVKNHPMLVARDLYDFYFQNLYAFVRFTRNPKFDSEHCNLSMVERVRQSNQARVERLKLP